MSLEPDPPALSTRSRIYRAHSGSSSASYGPLVDPLVGDHLVLGQDVPVVAQEVLGLLDRQESGLATATARLTTSKCRSMMSMKAEARFRFCRLMFLEGQLLLKFIGRH